MPETVPQWLWFLFFAGGAVGGWGFIVLAAPIVLDESRRLLKKRRVK